MARSRKAAYSVYGVNHHHDEPVPLRQHLVGHAVDTAFERGWSDLQNGELLDRAEVEGLERLIYPAKEHR